MIRLPDAISQLIQDGGTLVVPSQQRAHAARLADAAANLARGRQVWRTPDILPLEGWLAREIEWIARDQPLPRLLTSAEEWLLWRDCTVAATSDVTLVNRVALAEGLRTASSLAADFEISPGHLDRVQGAETALLRDVQRRVEERSREMGAINTSAALQRVRSLGGPRPVCFAGFLRSSPRLRALVAAREGQGQPVESWPTAAMRPLTAPSTVMAADETAETEAIARWCQERVERSRGVRLLIAFPGAPGARERLASLIQQLLAPRRWLHSTSGADEDEALEDLVAIEGGRPLARRPAVAHALTTLTFLMGESLDFEALSEWLRAPYWDLPLAGTETQLHAQDAQRARLDLWLRQRRKTTMDLRDLLAALQGAPAALHSLARAVESVLSSARSILGQSQASPRVWSERFRSALQGLAWPGARRRGSGEEQTVARFHELLDEFGCLVSAVTSLSPRRAVCDLAELAARTAYRPADADATVTITGTLADPVVHYDAIWVAGLGADTFPQPVQPDPYLPLAAQIAAGIPAATANGRLDEARELIAAWCRSARELVLSAPARVQDIEVVASPLLAAFAPLERTRAARSAVWLPERIRRDGLLETFEDSRGTPWPEERPLPSGTRSLELQNLCGFRAYAELRLGSVELEAPEPGVAADLRGRLLHEALQRLWDRLGNWHNLAASSAAALDVLISQCVAEAADATVPRAPVAGSPRRSLANYAQQDLFGTSQHSPVLVRECRRTARLINGLCSLERERAPFRVEATEQDTTLEIMGARLRMRIDRVDALEAGGRAILDYKSGRRMPADWYAERPSHPQLLAYLAAVGADTQAIASVHVNAREICFQGIASSPNLLPKVDAARPPDPQISACDDERDAWQQRRYQWLACLERLAGDFLQGRAQLDPKPGACELCHVISVCRITDRSAVGELEPGPLGESGDG
ncbi:MAG TPA: PD-(D/E)XK nuclease family protein [Steroidobacteraceae bacterium]|nr:PD-(D/E)XK nuclease family protein [Steroidobacteraceae bacterium]